VKQRRLDFLCWIAAWSAMLAFVVALTMLTPKWW
jgi:hypothetical protein